MVCSRGAPFFFRKLRLRYALALLSNTKTGHALTAYPSDTASSPGLGSLLAQWRLALGLTQAQLAEQAGISERAVSDLERGLRRAPYPGTLKRLAEALRLSDAQLASLMAARAPNGRERSAARFASPPFADRDLQQHTKYLPLTSLIGREREVGELRALLENVRLLTVTGTGGIGKTRLAEAAAEAVSDRFEHGLLFVALAAVRDPGVVLSVIASCLGVRDAGSRLLFELVLEHVKDKRLLLLLDNFEQIADAAPLLPQLLADAPGLTVLVTSRATLHVTGEHEYPLAPLAVPDSQSRVPVEEMADVASVKLFVERARAARPQFALTSENAAAVAEVCRYLDGVPLAIELAAARVRVLPPEVLLERLKSDAPGRGVDLLTGGARDLPVRQQTLRATIDWSYRLLTAPEQTVFRGLSVFVGGCTLEDAEAVLHAPPRVNLRNETRVLDHIEGLVTKSLLEGMHVRPPRFRMLETVREYAAELLERHPEGAAVGRAHAMHYLALAERAEARLSSREASVWLDRLEVEHDNLRAALQWMLDNGDPELGMRLTGALWRFWYIRGHLREGGQWLEKALTAWREASSGRLATSIETPALAKALTGAGVLAHYRAEYGLAADQCGKALGVSRRIGDRARIAAALDGLALVARAGGNYSAVRAMYQEAIEILEALDDNWGLSYTLRYLGAALWLEADYAAARPVAERALAIARELGDEQGITTALTVLSFITTGQGDGAGAEALARRALTLLEGFGDRRGSSRAHWALANAIVIDRRYAEAHAHYKLGLAIAHEISDQWFLPWCLMGMAVIAVNNGDPLRAVRLLAACWTLANGVAPCLRVQSEQIRSAARAAIDESAWASAWQAGLELSYEEAVNEGLAVGPPSEPQATSSVKPVAESLLTHRELQVARLVADGLTNRRIAAELVIAEGTADRHVANILSKLGFASRAQIGAWVAGRHG